MTNERVDDETKRATLKSMLGASSSVVAFSNLSGVQDITVAIHIPLNNHIQRIKIEDLNDQALADQRLKFETKWTFFNHIRTNIAISVSSLLLILLAIR